MPSYLQSGVYVLDSICITANRRLGRSIDWFWWSVWLINNGAIGTRIALLFITCSSETALVLIWRSQPKRQKQLSSSRTSQFVRENGRKTRVSYDVYVIANRSLRRAIIPIQLIYNIYIYYIYIYICNIITKLICICTYKHMCIYIHISCMHIYVSLHVYIIYTPYNTHLYILLATIYLLYIDSQNGSLIAHDIYICMYMYVCMSVCLYV